MHLKHPEAKEIYQHAQEYTFSLTTKDVTLSNVPAFPLSYGDRQYLGAGEDSSVTPVDLNQNGSCRFI